MEVGRASCCVAVDKISDILPSLSMLAHLVLSSEWNGVGFILWSRGVGLAWSRSGEPGACPSMPSPTQTGLQTHTVKDASYTVQPRARAIL